jgi:hypothetical protein
MTSVLDQVRKGQLQGPARRRTLLVGGFGAWTVLVWLGRVRNVVTADDLSGGSRAFRLILALLFVAAGAAVLVRLWQALARRSSGSGSSGSGSSGSGSGGSGSGGSGSGGSRSGRGRGSSVRPVLQAVALTAVLTIVVWLVQGSRILFGDHGGGFKLVHTVLAIGSIALAVLAWRSVAPRSPSIAARR